MACCLGLNVAMAQTYVIGSSGNATTCSGVFTDSGGETGNYGNNRKTSIDYFQIFPCGAKEIRLNFIKSLTAISTSVSN